MARKDDRGRMPGGVPSRANEGPIPDISGSWSAESNRPWADRHTTAHGLSMSNRWRARGISRRHWRRDARHSGLRHDLACLEGDDRSGCLLSGRTINRRENGKAMPWKWSTLLVIVKSLSDDGERYVVTQSLGCGESSVWPCSRDRQRAGAEGHWWESTVRHDYHL